MMFGEMGGGEGLLLWTEEGLDGAPGGRPEIIQPQVRIVARASTEGRQMVSMGR